jgi:all-trans-8'-apo-beta-carotenal 15,15'-oxygenase
MVSMPEKPTHPWRGVYNPLSREHGWEPLRVEGAIPADLRGTLYRNAPSLLSVGQDPYVHAFDADGAMIAVRFGEGAPQGAVRVTDTPWLRKERAAGRQLYRSYAQLGRGWRRWFTLPKNQANIAVMPWNGRLFALWEAGLPIELDPNDLSTLGESTLEGRIGPTFCAHPHAIGETTYGFGIRYGPRFSLDLYELTDGVRRTGSVPLRFPTLIHDFIPTPRYDVFLCPPRHLHTGKLALGLGSFIENLRWEPEHGTEILIVPRGAPERCVRFTVPAFFLWHIVAGWEEGEEIVVDFLRYEDDATDAWFGRAPWEVQAPAPSRYVRARIDPVARRWETEVRCELPCEFSGMDPRQAGGKIDRCWMLAWTGGDGAVEAPKLVRFEPDGGVWAAAPMSGACFPGEPVVVPREGGGVWVLSVVYDGEKGASFVGIWDGDRWPGEAVGRVWFGEQVPLSFHGGWVGGPCWG